MQQCFFFGQVCFSFLMSLLKKLGCLGVISLFIPHFFLNRKALFPRMKWTVTRETLVTKMSLTFLYKTLEN